MKQTKRSVLCLSLLLTAGMLYAQDPGVDNGKLNIIPPSPEAAKLAEFGEIPVGYYTGAVNFSIPLATIKAGSITLPVSLDYSSGGGVKVGEVANSIGLGWNLSAANVITRSVMGDADEQDGYLTTTANQYTPAFLDHLPETATSSDYVSHIQSLVRIADGCFDFEPDIFYYNFAGYTGKFYFDWNGNLVNMSSSPLKIAYTQDQTGINQWTITTETGLKYTFGATERTTSQVPTILGSYSPCPSFQDFYSSWYLSRIEDADGNFINLTYDYYDYQITGYASQQVELTTDNSGSLSAWTGGCTPFGWSPPQLGIKGNGAYAAPRLLTYYQARVKTITSSDSTKLAFTYTTSRQDHAGFLALHHFNALDNIALIYNGVTTRQWALAHNYNTGRLTLTQVSEQDNAAQNDHKYQFQYTDSIPSSIYSFAIDDWGFYNNRPNQTSVPTFIEHPYMQGQGVYQTFVFDGADRTVDTAFSTNGLLKKIIYPTGGSTEFIYEAHDCGMVTNRQISTYHFHPKHWNYPTATAVSNANETLVVDLDTFSVPETTIVTVDWSAYIGNNTSCNPNYKPQMVIRKITGTPDSIKKQFNYTSGPPVLGNYAASELYELQPGTYVLIAQARCYDNTNHIPDEASVTVRYQEADTSVTLTKIPVGGARIKRIKTTDNYNNITDQLDFSYNMPGSPQASSGVIEGLPNYRYETVHYFSFSCGGGLSTMQTRGLINIMYSAQNVNILGATSGSHIGYQWVTVTEKGKGKKEYHYTSPAQYYDDIDINYPFMPPSHSQEHKTGLLLDENDYRLSGAAYALLHKVHRDYVFKDSSIMEYGVTFLGDGDTALSHGVLVEATPDASYNTYYTKAFKFDNYQLTSGYVRLSAETMTDYLPDQNASVSITTTRTYNAAVPQLVKSESVTNSDGRVNRTDYTYPTDQATTPAITAMLNRNMVALPITTKTYVSNVLTSTVKNTYALFNTSHVALQKKETSTYNTALQTEVTYNKYDGNGNPLVYTTTGNATTALLWSYIHSYPVAEIKNVDTAALTAYLAAHPTVQATCDNPASDAALRTAIQQLRTQFPDAAITGFTYKPPLGITSRTEPNGVTTYYEYDAFGRLSVIRDDNQSIIKSFTYKYQGQ